MRFRLLLVLFALLAAACGSGDRAVPSEEEQAQMDAQFAKVFDGIDATEADREGVKAAHLVAYWVRNYHHVEGHYPLAEKLEENGLDYVETRLYGTNIYADDAKPEFVQRMAFFAELREVLGESVVPPQDPDPQDLQGLHYSTVGISFMVACDLESPVNGGEMATDTYGQYSVASYTGESPPIHDIEKILAGEIAALGPAEWRIPSMAR